VRFRLRLSRWPGFDLRHRFYIIFPIFPKIAIDVDAHVGRRIVQVQIALGQF
jgi:hypothetical protein